MNCPALLRRSGRTSPKALWDDPAYEFDFVLAETLGMTVKELKTGKPGVLSNLEWVEWRQFMLKRQSQEQVRKR